MELVWIYASSCLPLRLGKDQNWNFRHSYRTANGSWFYGFTNWLLQFVVSGMSCHGCVLFVYVLSHIILYYTLTDMFFKFISLLDLGQLDLGYLVHVESVNYIKVLLFWSSWNPLMYCSASSSGSTKCSRYSGVLASWTQPVSARGKVEKPTISIAHSIVSRMLLISILCSFIYLSLLIVQRAEACEMTVWSVGQSRT